MLAIVKSTDSHFHTSYDPCRLIKSVFWEEFSSREGAFVNPDTTIQALQKDPRIGFTSPFLFSIYCLDVSAFQQKKAETETTHSSHNVKDYFPMLWYKQGKHFSLMKSIVLICSTVVTDKPTIFILGLTVTTVPSWHKLDQVKCSAAQLEVQPGYKGSESTLKYHHVSL